MQGQWRRRGFFQLSLDRRTVHVDALTGSRTSKLDAKQIILTAQFALASLRSPVLKSSVKLAEIFVNAR